jgi:endonuclease-3
MERLCRTLPDWNRAADASLSTIAAAIKPAGLHRQKARSIRAILRHIRDERGRITLDFLRRWPTDRIKEYLLALSGVGPKTAACVLLFSLRRPVLPVDTHVHRVTRRLGLIGPRITAEQAHDVLAAVVPPRKVYAFHVLLIEHGRKVCHARRPECGECVLYDICPSAFTFPPPRRPQARPMRPPRVARQRT